MLFHMCEVACGIRCLCDVLLKCVLPANIKRRCWTLRYNVYIPLLIREANDIEENPVPTIFDIIDPTTTVSATVS